VADGAQIPAVAGRWANPVRGTVARPGSIPCRNPWRGIVDVAGDGRGDGAGSGNRGRPGDGRDGGHRPAPCADGRRLRAGRPAGLQQALASDYDVIVLDRDLPGMHGDEVCGRLAAAGCRSRVLMLTAAAATEDLVEGLSLGADDYLPKPFDFPVLVARIGALFRRAQPAIAPVMRCGDLAVDTGRRLAWRAGQQLDLAPKEFGVLEVLLAAQGRAVSAEELLERVWDQHADPFTAAVKITVSRLRAKLGDPQLISTVPRSGYQIGGPS
jgi:DNA-binding response OmpR family regulator